MEQTRGGGAGVDRGRGSWPLAASAEKRCMAELIGAGSGFDAVSARLGMLVAITGNAETNVTTRDRRCIAPLRRLDARARLRLAL
jgi:hypothetical protein